MSPTKTNLPNLGVLQNHTLRQQGLWKRQHWTEDWSPIQLYHQNTSKNNRTLKTVHTDEKKKFSVWVYPTKEGVSRKYKGGCEATLKQFYYEEENVERSGETRFWGDHHASLLCSPLLACFTSNYCYLVVRNSKALLKPSHEQCIIPTFINCLCNQSHCRNIHDFSPWCAIHTGMHSGSVAEISMPIAGNRERYVPVHTVQGWTRSKTAENLLHCWETPQGQHDRLVKIHKNHPL